MNTFFRLLVLLPATAFALLMAWVGIGFAGLGFWSLAVHLGFVAIPIALIVWTIRDHYKRKSLVGRNRMKS